MIAAGIGVSSQSLQDAFSESPLEKHRSYVRKRGAEPLPPPAQLDVTMYTSSPLKDFAADVKRDLTYNLRPMGRLPEPISAVHTPKFTRGSYQMHADPGLRLTVELGPILWMRADRSAEGSIGRMLNEVA